jgi:hypothetical protein
MLKQSEEIQVKNERGMAIAKEIREQRNNLLKFSLAGNVDEVSKILEKRPQLVDHKDPEGNTALHFAAKNIDLKMLKLLVDKGAKINIPNNAANPIERTALGLLQKQKLTWKGDLANVLSPSGIYEDPTEAIEFLEHAPKLRENRKKRAAKLKSLAKKDTLLKEDSATKIQSVYRGMKSRGVAEEKKEEFKKDTADFIPVLSKRNKKPQKKLDTKPTVEISSENKKPANKPEYSDVSSNLTYADALTQKSKLKEEHDKIVDATKKIGEAVKNIYKEKNATNIQKLVRGVQAKGDVKELSKLDRLNRINDFTQELLKLDSTKIKGIKELKASLGNKDFLKDAIKSNDALNEFIGKFSKDAKSNNIEMLGRLASGKPTERDKLLMLVDNFKDKKDLSVKSGSVTRTGGYKSNNQGQRTH